MIHPGTPAQPVSRRAHLCVLLAALSALGCDRAPETSPPPEAPATATPEETEVEAVPETATIEHATEEEDVWVAIDTHVDTTQRMLDAQDDIGERMPDGHLDLPRMREGGLTGAFFSIWVRPSSYPGERAWQRTRDLIGAVAAAGGDTPGRCDSGRRRGGGAGRGP